MYVSIHNFDSDIAIPDVVAMVLQSDKAFFAFSTAVEQEFVSKRPFIFAKFALVEHFLPSGRPEMVLYAR